MGGGYAPARGAGARGGAARYVGIDGGVRPAAERRAVRLPPPGRDVGAVARGLLERALRRHRGANGFRGRTARGRHRLRDGLRHGQPGASRLGRSRRRLLSAHARGSPRDGGRHAPAGPRPAPDAARAGRSGVPHHLRHVLSLAGARPRARGVPPRPRAWRLGGALLALRRTWRAVGPPPDGRHGGGRSPDAGYVRAVSRPSPRSVRGLEVRGRIRRGVAPGPVIHRRGVPRVRVDVRVVPTLRRAEARGSPGTSARGAGGATSLRLRGTERGIPVPRAPTGLITVAWSHGAPVTIRPRIRARGERGTAAPRPGNRPGCLP